MNLTDEVHVARQVLQHTFARVTTVGTDHELPVGEPTGQQREQFDQQFRPCAVVTPFGPLPLLLGPRHGLRRPLFLFAFGHTLAVDIQTEQQRHGKHLGRRPAGQTHEQRQHDPVVAPGKDLEGLAGEQGIVVHASAKQSQAAFAAQGIVGGQQHRPRGDETPQQETRQDTAEVVQGPGVVREEAVKAGPVTDADLTGSEDTFGDIAVSAGQRPAGEEQDEEAKGGSGENGAEVL